VRWWWWWWSLLLFILGLKYRYTIKDLTSSFVY
jgi:hypothetical protein